MLVLDILRAAVLAVVAVIAWAVAHPYADVPLALVALVVFVHFKPYRECRWCRPGGLIGGSLAARLGGHRPERRRTGRCWRCKGTRLTRRLGAYHVHKAKLSLVQAWEEREFRR